MTENLTNNSDMSAVIDTARKSVEHTTFKTEYGDTVAVVPDDYSLITIDETINPALSEHVIEDFTVIEKQSFIEYINLFKGDSSILTAVPEKAKMTSTLDYHGQSDGDKAKTNHCRHTVDFKMAFDPYWERWREIDGMRLSQVDFAYFVEEMLHTIASPNGADLLEMAENLKINRGVVFKSGKRLADGTMNVQYTEEDEAKSNGGNVTVPEDITIVSAMYMFGKKVEIKAKLRYRFEKGEPLSFIVSILNRKVLEFDEFKKVADDVKAQTSIPLFYS